MSRISTGTGDEGKTGLVDGSRVPKTHPRIVAVGSVDEANDALGVAIAHLPAGDARAFLVQVQADLFTLGADLASPEGTPGALRVSAADVARVSARTDALEATLPPLRSFILPGGSPSAAYLQVARSAVRRAERDAWALAASGGASATALVYLNRLSDCLFLMARAENARLGVEEPKWPGKQG